MKNSIYTTAAGMMTSAERMNVITNNLANFSTNGYKADIPFEQTIKFLTEGPYPGKDQPVMGGTALDMQQGLIKHTDRKLDFAIEGPGLFTVQGPNNETLYTRNGVFNLNSKRELVTSEGFNVLDKFDRKITIFGQKLQITPSADIIIDDNYHTSFKMIDTPDKDDIEKVGSTFFKFKDSTKQPTVLAVPSLIVGALEKSNVNVLKGIGVLTRTQRAFELQKTAADLVLKMVRKAISDLPKPI
ncbi:MAG: flagellar hook basal-body protein [bacterium]|nr:flagellar hook basal-body protein [bacterium]